MSAEAWARAEEHDARSEDNDLSVDEREGAALEFHHVIWPYYFADPSVAGRDSRSTASSAVRRRAPR
jgi:hypothetical protein